MARIRFSSAMRLQPGIAAEKMPITSCQRSHAGDAMPSPAPGIRERALRRRFAIIRFASGFYLDFFRTSSNRNSSATAQAMDTANPARPPDTPSIGAR